MRSASSMFEHRWGLIGWSVVCAHTSTWFLADATHSWCVGCGALFLGIGYGFSERGACRMPNGDGLSLHAFICLLFWGVGPLFVVVLCFGRGPFPVAWAVVPVT